MFAFLYHSIDVDSVAQILSRTNPWWALLSVLATCLAVMVMGVRWRSVCSVYRLEESVPYFIRLQFVGLWFNQILPGGIGGDAVKMVALRRHFGKGQGAVVSTLFDRLSGLMAIVFFVLIGLPLSFDLFAASPVKYLFALLCAGGFGGFVVLLYLHKVSILESIPVVKWISKISVGAHLVYVQSKRVLLTNIWTSLIVQFLGVVNFYLAALALGVDVEFWQMFVLIPPVFILLMVPISLAGWGLREGVVVGLFTLAGLMGAEEALSVSLLYGFLLIISAVPGGLMLLFKFKE